MRISKEHMNIYKEYKKVIDKIIKEKRTIMFVNKFTLKKEDYIAFTLDEELEHKSGKYKFENGDTYVGKVINNDMQGKGIYIFNDECSSTYVGEFNENMKEGRGYFDSDTKNSYIGEYRQDKMCGIGKMIYKSGDTYIGNWKDNKKHGDGIYEWKDGGVYVGEFINGKMEGNGTCYDDAGNIIYSGEWKNNLIHGYGKYVWTSEKWYEGEFINGKKHGKGSFYLNNELVYEGTWKFDKPSIFNRGLEEIFSIKL